MKSFKLILLFVLLSNGYGQDDLCNECNDSQSTKDQDSTINIGDFLNDLGFVASQQITSKKKNLDNLDKKLGYGSFNNIDGQYSILLVKNSKGDIDNANSIPNLDKDLAKWVKYSKSSSPDDNIA